MLALTELLVKLLSEIFRTKFFRDIYDERTVIKVLTALVSQLSLSVGGDKGPERGLKLFLSTLNGL